MAVDFYFCGLFIAVTSNLVLCIQDIRPHVSTVPSGNILKYANDELNLTCKFTSNYSSSYRISWILPIKEGGRVSHQESSNEVMVSIHPLQEVDSGPYTCAVTGHGVHVTKEIYVKVKSAKASSCSLKMFPCSRGICIPQRFVCDGFFDCPGNKDEAVDVCGVDPPCKGKIQCDDGRCVSAEKCCDPPSKPTNCRQLYFLPCCSHFASLEDVEHQQRPGGSIPSASSPPSPHYSDISFIQSTIYTIVSCAIAFIFITLIMIVAICRIHMKRSAMSLHPPAGTTGIPHGSSPGSLNTRRRLLFFLWPFCRLASHHHHRGQGQALPRCGHRSRTPRWRPEDDLASSDSLCENGVGGANHPYPCTISSTGSFVVMYSSANGVRLIERLPKPPPYSEASSGPSNSPLNPLLSSPEATWVPPNTVTSSAEVWGPPPAYYSMENIHRVARDNERSEATPTTALL